MKRLVLVGAMVAFTVTSSWAGQINKSDQKGGAFAFAKSVWSDPGTGSVDAKASSSPNAASASASASSSSSGGSASSSSSAAASVSVGIGSIY